MASLVGLVRAVGQRAFGHIHLAAENRFKRKLALYLLDFRSQFGADLLGFPFGCLLDLLLKVGQLAFILAFDFVDVVEIFLDTEHVAVVCQRESRHTEIHRLVYKTGDRSLPVKQGILAMYV